MLKLMHFNFGTPKYTPHESYCYMGHIKVLEQRFQYSDYVAWINESQYILLFYLFIRIFIDIISSKYLWFLYVITCYNFMVRTPSN